MSKKTRYYSLIFVLYMFIFQFGLMQISSVFTYWDEIYALSAIPLFLISRKKYSIKRNIYSKLIMLLILFIVTGLLANLMYRYQVWLGVLTDMLLQLKFFLGIVTTYYIYRRMNFSAYRNHIKWHVKVIMAALFLLVLANKSLHIFPNGDARFGLKSEMLFFGHPTGLASVSYFMTILLMLLYKKNSSDKYFVFLGIVLVLSTLRFKAIAAALLFCYMFFILVIRNQKLTGWKMVPFVPFAFIAGWDEFYGYFFSANTMDYARGALFHTAIRIAKDHFPLGAGIGTFASDPSGTYYSPLYTKYGIETVWGLGEDNPFLVTDTFWPMIMGQNGFIGVVLYILIIICLFKIIRPAYKINKNMYLAGLGAIVYLLVSSIAESAFVNPLSLPLALIIGLVVCRIEQEEERVIYL